MVKKCYNNKIYDHYTRLESHHLELNKRFLWEVGDFYNVINSLPLSDRLFVSPVLQKRVHRVMFMYFRLMKTFGQDLKETSHTYNVEIEKIERRLARFVFNYFTYLNTNVDRLLKHKAMSVEEIMTVLEFCKDYNFPVYISHRLSAHLIFAKLKS